MSRALESPEKPLAALMGGAKVSDKILLLENILDKLDHLFIGGGMCVTFLKAQGHGVGASLVEEDRAGICTGDAGGGREKGDQGASAGRGGGGQRVLARPGGGPGDYVRRRSRWWNHHGHRSFGSERVCQLVEGVSHSDLERAYGRVRDAQIQRGYADSGIRHRGLTRSHQCGGGGSTAETVEALGLMDRMTHVSTGGGASLEFLGGIELPGIAALPDAD